MNDPFRDASTKAEEFLEFLYLVDSLSSEGKTSDAEKVLMGAVALGKLFTPVLTALKEPIAAISEGQIRSFKRNGKVHHFVSAHHAVVYYWHALYISTSHPAWQLPPSVREWLGVDLSLLTAHIQRERAKGPKLEGEWMKRAAAARRLKVASTTIGRYVEDGKLFDNGGEGPDRLIFVPSNWESPRDRVT